MWTRSDNCLGVFQNKASVVYGLSKTKIAIMYSCFMHMNAKHLTNVDGLRIEYTRFVPFSGLSAISSSKNHTGHCDVGLLHTINVV